jgi:hypothetical protein
MFYKLLSVYAFQLFNTLFAEPFWYNCLGKINKKILAYQFLALPLKTINIANFFSFNQNCFYDFNTILADTNHNW